MGEEVINAVQKFMHFYTTQWAILGNLFQASAALYSLQSASSPELQIQLAKAHSDIDETIALTISTFNGIISKITKQREMSADAFRFLADDLDRATKDAKQVAESLKEEYNEAVKAHVTILKTKIIEIAEKVSQHLEKQE